MKKVKNFLAFYRPLDGRSEALFPGIQLGIGPPISNGFYYDIDFGTHVFNATHLPMVEEKMLALARQKNTYQRMEVSKADARVVRIELLAWPAHINAIQSE